MKKAFMIGLLFTGLIDCAACWATRIPKEYKQACAMLSKTVRRYENATIIANRKKLSEARQTVALVRAKSETAKKLFRYESLAEWRGLHWASKLLLNKLGNAMDDFVQLARSTGRKQICDLAWIYHNAAERLKQEILCAELKMLSEVFQKEVNGQDLRTEQIEVCGNYLEVVCAVEDDFSVVKKEFKKLKNNLSALESSLFYNYTNDCLQEIKRELQQGVISQEDALAEFTYYLSGCESAFIHESYQEKLKQLVQDFSQLIAILKHSEHKKSRL